MSMKKKSKYLMIFISAITLMMASLSLPYTNFLSPLPAYADEYTLEQYVDSCFAETAKNALPREELLKVADLYFNVLQPQAVDLLIEKMPAFKDAADKGLLSRNIGVYIYYKDGDNDNNAHIASGGAASNHPAQLEGGKVGNILMHDINYLVSEDKNGNNIIVTDTSAAEYFCNAVVHELVHSFMMDYNRSGMLGTGRPEYYRINSDDADADLFIKEKWNQLLFPEWFQEGVACVIDGSYSSDEDFFCRLSIDPDETVYSFTAESVFEGYLDDETYAIGMGTNIGSYYMSIPAILYLSELQAVKNGRSSISEDTDGEKTFDSSALRQGLNTILTRLHDGETLDAVIFDISEGNFTDTNDFTERFIRGSRKPETDDYTEMEKSSAAFTADLLNYLENLSAKYEYYVSGSILFDFDSPNTCLLDTNKSSSADFYQPTLSADREPIIELPVPYTDGGKSAIGTSTPVYDEILTITMGLAAIEWDSFETERFDSAGSEDAGKMIADLHYPSNILKALDIALKRIDQNAILSYAAYDSETVLNTLSINKYIYDDEFLYDETVFTLILTRVEEVPATATENGIAACFAGNDGKKYDLYKEVKEEDLIIPATESASGEKEDPDSSQPTGDSGLLSLLTLCGLSLCMVFARTYIRKIF